MRSQKEKANDLLRLHSGGEMLVLPNVWDPLGARVLEAKGYPAVATASAAVSASLGFADGEIIRRSTMIDLIGRIARSVDVPVTADMEEGFGSSISELKETIDQVLESGVVGVNLQDSLDSAEHRLRPIDEQCQRLAAAREVANARNVHLVINARVDSFLSSSFPDKTKALQEAATRAKAYTAAGADCIYPIGPGDEPTVRALRDKIQSPINIIASPTAAPLSVLRKIGVNRVSFGPFVFRTCLAKFVEIVDAVGRVDGYAYLKDMMPGPEAAKFLRAGRE
ncbi:MAG TPA: isocitrate lyase/phosphoenolpyruvate mutase family protein [Tepidisphaeraceae bacterium]|jgi:2-methylisocitrate lyase-like PEP mutase family enzyme